MVGGWDGSSGGSGAGSGQVMVSVLERMTIRRTSPRRQHEATLKPPKLQTTAGTVCSGRSRKSIRSCHMFCLNRNLEGWSRSVSFTRFVSGQVAVTTLTPPPRHVPLACNRAAAMRPRFGDVRMFGPQVAALGFGLERHRLVRCLVDVAAVLV